MEDNSQAKPIKRHLSLQSLSRDHQEGLMICWKIKKGIEENVPCEKMEKHVNWFFETKLFPHFQIEEKVVFVVLGSENELVKKALDEHAELVRLFRIEGKDVPTLQKISDDLESHIRFEERVLFNEIQSVATPEQLQQIEASHNNPSSMEKK